MAAGSVADRLPWRRDGDPQRGFRILKADGTPVRSPAHLRRIARLAIPPGWTDVRIAADPRAPVQAVGRDAAGRLQYRYHPAVAAANQTRKFRRLLVVARSLPTLRAATNAHLRQTGLGRERVLALVVRLMQRAFFRVGSERYAVRNRTYGLVTLEKRHVRCDGDTLVFRYRGKHRIWQRQVVAQTPLVTIVQELQALPGRRLFRYVDEAGQIRNVTASLVNAYLRELVPSARITSKDFRTWGATVRAATILADLGPPSSRTEAQRHVRLVCRLVAAELGHTPSVCRSAYIHPWVLERYLEGETIEPVMRRAPREVEADAPVGYYDEEAALLRALERWRRGRRLRTVNRGT